LTELDADVVVVGAGIVGLSAARAVQRRHGGQVLVLDKADRPAAHQSGRNSGVVHSGLYYRPGSDKATLVAAGRARLERYCGERALPYDRCGKVVVATSISELGALAELERRGAANGVEVERIGPARLHELEPHVRGLAALSVPGTAITDYRAVASSLADDLVADGGELRTGTEVLGIDPLVGGGVALTHSTGRVRARWLLNCAGLHSDRVAAMAGADTGVSIVPFRGEYHELVPSARHLVRNLVYPVPDPRWPFLGVHMTRMVDGSVHVGPNAVLALGREAYEGGADRRDLMTLAHDPGLRRLAGRYWRTGAAELLRSRSEPLLLRDVRRLLPGTSAADLRRAGAGIRAQALGRDGTLLDDFAFATSPHGVHVLNAPSPAATASFAIAEVIADRLDRLVEAG
jgi:L-2-hydroxyglutarate oxidase